jgi:hypothetical protein
MTKGKRKARRLALYLSSIEISLVPSANSYKQWAADLQAQYNALEAGQRTLARQTGRRLIKGAGSIAKAVASLPNPVVLQTQADSPKVNPRTRSRAEQFDEICRNWSELTPPCPSCRMRNRFPKRSWPTREWADEVRGRQHDRDRLCVYACPAQPGFWHLGHIRTPVVSAVTLEESHIPTGSVPFETGGHV